jgi:hypothetical protein
LGHAVGFLTIGLLTASLCISDKTLLSIQRCQQRCVGIRALNSRLYAYFEKQGVAPCSPLPARSSLIATDYLALRWLPDLAPRSVVCTCHKLTAFRQTFDRPDVRYILVQSGSAAAEVRTFLGRSAAVRLLFEDHGFSFYEKQGGQSQGPVQEQLVVFRP